jgi:uncharacterized membrane protein
MPRSAVVSIVILAIGAVLLVWGFNASDSLASEVSEAVQGAPSDKSIALMVIGGLFAAVGVVGLVRRAH